MKPIMQIVVHLNSEENNKVNNWMISIQVKVFSLFSNQTLLNVETKNQIKLNEIKSNKNKL
jgi:hypothetical protein